MINILLLFVSIDRMLIKILIENFEQLFMNVYLSNLFCNDVVS